VHISYEIVVDTVRAKEQTPCWKKSCGLRVPFMVHHNTRPPASGPFPLNPSGSSSKSGPQTLFTFKFEPGDLRKPLIKAHVFLPASQVCTLSEPIPFFVTLFGAEAALDSFKSHQPSVTSFLPMHDITGDPADTVQAQLRACDTASPVSLKLQRTTIMYTHQMSVFAHAEARMHDTEVIGRGVVQRSRRGRNSITWSGTILVDPSLTCGGFDVGTVRVLDSVVLCVNIPDSRSDSGIKTFREAIPMRLTTRPYSCSSAVRLSE